jgi:hypothetical protein
MPEVLPELQAYLQAQMPGQGLAREVLGGIQVSIAKVIAVPPCDSPTSGGVLGVSLDPCSSLTPGSPSVHPDSGAKSRALRAGLTLGPEEGELDADSCHLGNIAS